MVAAKKKSKVNLVIDTDNAKRSKRLLDTIEGAKYAIDVLADIKEKYAGKKLSGGALNDIQLVIDALSCLYEDGQQNTAKVSNTPYLLHAYKKRKAAELELDNNDGQSSNVKVKSAAVAKLDRYIIQQKGEVINGDAQLEDQSTSPPKRRRSNRKPIGRITPDKRSDELPDLHTILQSSDNILDKWEKGTVIAAVDAFTGGPPVGDEVWSKESIAIACNKLKGTSTTTAFMKKLVVGGKCGYSSHGGIQKMYDKWRVEGKVTGKVGRNSVLTLNEVEAAVQKKFKNCNTKSNTFQLSDMKSSIEEKRKRTAEEDGLDPETIDCKVSNTTAKVALIAAAMGDECGTLSNKKLLHKTSTRWQMEHSVQAAVSNTLTCISTHYIAGPTPPNLIRKFDEEKLSKSTKETIELMKEALGVNHVYPVDPNLCTSTDDTTIWKSVVAQGGSGEWEWKLIDKENGNSSVRADFEEGADDADGSGGLRVRMTFTATATGLYAPAYISVSGLTEEELCPVKCPEGICVEKVQGLCKGGHDVFNEGFGYLCFLRADKKGKKDKNALSMGNKKFMDYNDRVFLPFIQEIRIMLGWKYGQPLPEWLRCVSWFDGDIPQLQTMICEAREATDIALNIIRNKHPAAATGSYQPCDLSPVFRLLKFVASRSTAKNSHAVSHLRKNLEAIFSVNLRLKGLNLDHNPRKKKALMDLLLCMPENYETVLKEKHGQKSFLDAGMIDEELKMCPNIDSLMANCKRWGSMNKNIGISREMESRSNDSKQGISNISF